MHVRPATLKDSQAMSAVLAELVAAKKRQKASDPDFVAAHYVSHPNRIECSVAVDAEGIILGFQSLIIARAGNPYDTPVGWGIIGTHVRPCAARRGVGSKLFQSTLKAAREAGLQEIEAFIGERNNVAIAYYEAIGFCTYRTAKGAVCKSYKVS